MKTRQILLIALLAVLTIVAIYIYSNSDSLEENSATATSEVTTEETDEQQLLNTEEILVEIDSETFFSTNSSSVLVSNTVYGPNKNLSLVFRPLEKLSTAELKAAGRCKSDGVTITCDLGLDPDDYTTFAIKDERTGEIVVAYELKDEWSYLISNMSTAGNENIMIYTCSEHSAAIWLRDWSVQSVIDGVKQLCINPETGSISEMK